MSAKIHLKQKAPDTYIQVCVDAGPCRKTETIKKSLSPQWDESLTMYSIIFKLYYFSILLSINLVLFLITIFSYL